MMGGCFTCILNGACCRSVYSWKQFFFNRPRQSLFSSAMPLLRSCHPFPAATFAVWQIEEEEAFFLENLVLSAAERQEWQGLKGLRRREWRWLLHHISGYDLRLPLAKDAFSKPFFPSSAGMACSLSHSLGLVGALLVEQGGGAVGCDLQVLVEKMPALAPRFLNTREMEFLKNHSADHQFDLAHLFWTAKESLYKAYGMKELDFRKHLWVEPFDWDGYTAIALGTVIKNDYQQGFRLWMEKNELPDGRACVWTVCTREN